MAASLPVLLFESPTVGNEPLAGLLGAATALAALDLFQSRGRRPSAWRFAAVGGLWGHRRTRQGQRIGPGSPVRARLRLVGVERPDSASGHAASGLRSLRRFPGDLRLVLRRQPAAVWQGRDRRLGSAGRIRVVAGSPAIARSSNTPRSARPCTGRCSVSSRGCGTVSTPGSGSTWSLGGVPNRLHAPTWNYPFAIAALAWALLPTLALAAGAVRALAMRGEPSQAGARPRVRRGVLVLRGGGLPGVDRRCTAWWCRTTAR